MEQSVLQSLTYSLFFSNVSQSRVWITRKTNRYEKLRNFPNYSNIRKLLLFFAPDLLDLFSSHPPRFPYLVVKCAKSPTDHHETPFSVLLSVINDPQHLHLCNRFLLSRPTLFQRTQNETRRSAFKIVF